MQSAPAWAERLLVFAPSSMTEVIGKLNEAFEDQHGITAIASIAGTAQLARQVEAGAPAHIFISADRKWGNYLAKAGNIVTETRLSIAKNTLVVAVRRETENWADVEKLLTTGRFSMAEPENIPAGRYAREALENLNWWPDAKTHAVFGENVRVALRSLARGEVDAAIVYQTDLRADPDVRAAYTFRSDQHSPIIYEATLVQQAQSNENARTYLSFLTSDTALSILLKAGFSSPR